MDNETLRKKVEESIIAHRAGMDKITALEEVEKISMEHDMNIIGMINSLASFLSSRIEFDIANEETIKKVDELIHSFAKDLEKHPVDTCVILLKILSDIIVQITVYDDLVKNNK